jgi:Ca2+/Na+ antiporter
VAALSTALNSNALNVALGLLLPAAFIGLAKPSGEDTLVAAWYAGLTILTLTLAYTGRGLRRWAGWVIIVGYAAFAVSLLVAS